MPYLPEGWTFCFDPSQSTTTASSQYDGLMIMAPSSSGEKYESVEEAVAHYPAAYLRQTTDPVDFYRLLGLNASDNVIQEIKRRTRDRLQKEDGRNPPLVRNNPAEDGPAAAAATTKTRGPMTPEELEQNRCHNCANCKRPKCGRCRTCLETNMEVCLRTVSSDSPGSITETQAFGLSKLMLLFALCE